MTGEPEFPKASAPHPLADLELPREHLVLPEIALIKELVRSRTMGEASESAGVKDYVGRKMAFRLVEMGVLQARKRNSSHVWVFTKGPRAYGYCRRVDQYVRGGRLGSLKLPPEPRLRVHRGGWSFRLSNPPGNVPWEAEWQPKGSEGPEHFRLFRSGVGFWLVKARGESPLLTVEPQDDWISDPGEVAGVAGVRVQRAVGAKEYAVQFLTKFGGAMMPFSIAQASPTEYAVEIAGLEPFGRPGVDLIWADRSLGGARVELETQDAGLAGALLDWAYEPEKRTISEVVETVMKQRGIVAVGDAP